MNSFVQYHNVQNEGLLLSNPPFSASRLAIHTRRPNVQKAEGRVYLIAGIGRPRRFFLWESFQIEAVKSNGDGEFEASGTGWQLAPSIELTGKPFEEFKAACANFVGFRSINDLPFTRTLTKLTEDNRPPGKPGQIVSFLNTLVGLLPDDTPERAAVRTALGHYQPVRALSIRQPHAEAIMRGVKKIEYRSKATDETEMMADSGIRDVTCDQLPRGVLIGTVELFDCDGGNWHVRKPERAEKLVPPTKQPQPVWFYPF